MLPQGFTRVEWIQSTGNQYINTKLKSPANNLRIYCKYAWTELKASMSPFGVQTNGIFSIIPHMTNANTQGIYVGASANLLPFGAEANKWYSLDLKAENNLLTQGLNGVVSNANYAGTLDSEGEIYIFAQNVNGTPYSPLSLMMLSEMEIIVNSTIVRDYIPCIDENGDANLWDDVNEILAEKDGAFLYGAPVIPGALSNLVQINTQAGAAFSWKPAEYANEYVISRDGVKIAAVHGDVTSYTDIDANGTSTYTVTPYNGKQAGTGASITIITELAPPVNLNAALDGHTVTLTWDAVNGADGYYVHRDGAVVASVTSTSYTDTLIPPVSVAYAVSAYVGTIQSEMSRHVIVENWEGVLLTLITDRAAADVAEAKRLRDKLIAGEALTDEESARYFAGLRGAYNASDMNRVGAAVRYVAGRLNAEGYGAYVDSKTDWQMEDIVRQSDWNKYLDEVRHLRRKLTLMRTTPQITDGMYSGLKSYAEANAIEQILVDLDIAITCIIRNYIFSGEVFAGEV